MSTRFLIALLLASCLPARVSDIVPLSTQETAELTAMEHSVSQLQTQIFALEDRECELWNRIKKQHHAVGTSGGCRNSGWTTEFTTSPHSSWSFSKDFKFLVHEEN